MKKNTLDNLKTGEQAVILEYDSTALPAKFFEMGLIPGAHIEVKHVAPFNGPICYYIQEQNSLVAIRKSEAKEILIDISH